MAQHLMRRALHHFHFDTSSSRLSCCLPYTYLLRLITLKNNLVSAPLVSQVYVRTDIVRTDLKARP
jgi:hypothetical protein